MRKIIPIVISLLLPIQSALANDDLEFPAEIIGPVRDADKKMTKKLQLLPWAKQEDVWNLGDQVEAELRKNLKALDRKFEGKQVSRIDFVISDQGKIMDAEISTFAKDPAFDYLTKKMVLALDGKPLLRLPKKVRQLQIMVSATFTKSPAITSVFVKASQSRPVKIPSTRNRLLEKMKH